MFDEQLTKEEMELLKTNQVPERAEEPESSAPGPGDFLKEPEVKEPEVKAEPQDDWKAKYDNLQAALREERESRRKDRERLDAITDRIMQLQEKRELEQKPKPPDYETDPIGHQQYRIQELERQLAESSQKSNQAGEAVSRQAQYMQVMDAYRQSEDVFAKENPDFLDAKRYLMVHRDSELQALGMKDPAQRAQILRNDEANIIFQSFSNSADPASTIYGLAKLRGYTPNSKEKHIPDQKAPKSLSTVRGGTSKPMTLQGKADKILSMSDKDFANISDADLESFLKEMSSNI